MIRIRALHEDDAPAFLTLCRRLDEETSFMMLEPGERQTTVAQQRETIQRLHTRDNQIILVAEVNDRLAGYIEATGGDFRRNRHCAYLVIGVLRQFAGQGIGARLFDELEAWARRQKLHRLELTVMAHNTVATGLYQKRGFVIEGARKHALLVDGRYIDEYAMAKLLTDD